MTECKAFNNQTRKEETMEPDVIPKGIGNSPRIAPLIRVSTPGQEDKELSMPIQKAKMERWVAQLGGTVPKGCWYLGQEHATPGQDRALLDKLLRDAAAHRFDAVMIDDVSRWSRSGLKSEQALAVLRKHGIKFYVQTSPMNLANPVHKFMISTGVSLSEMQALLMAEKSIRSKIELARQGKPGVGSLPYGRTYDKKTEEWGVDPVKQELIQRAARRFLEGATMTQLERETDLSARKLYKIFGGGAGDTWKIRINPSLYPELAQDFVLKIPPLLDPDTLKALAKKLRRGRAFYQGNRGRGQHLLNNMIFCGHCGYALSGANIGDKAHHYYFHARQSGKGRIPCHHFSYVPADRLEAAIMSELYDFFGDKVKREEAIRKAHAGLEEAERVRAAIKSLQGELDKVSNSQDRLVDAIAEGTLSKDVAKGKLEKLTAREAELKERIAELEQEVAEMPSEQEIKAAAAAFTPSKGHPRPSRKVMEEQIEHSYLGSLKHFEEMTFEQRRELLRTLFGSADRVPAGDKKRGQKMPKFVKHGIYIQKASKGNWKYEMKGIIPTFTGYLPATKSLKVPDPSF